MSSLEALFIILFLFFIDTEVEAEVEVVLQEIEEPEEELADHDLNPHFQGDGKQEIGINLLS